METKCITVLFANTSLHLISRQNKYKKYTPCPMCRESSFLHHDYRDYSNYRCTDKNSKHLFSASKATAALPASVSALFGKDDLKRMRFPPFLIIIVLYQFFIGNSSTQKIPLMLSYLYNIKSSHVTIADCTNYNLNAKKLLSLANSR